MSFISLRALSAWRVRAGYSSAPPGGDSTAGNWTIARQDGLATPITVSSVWSPDTNQLELALSAALIPGTGYTLTNSAAASLGAIWNQPLSRPELTADREDPEAEAFGVDMDWFADDVDPTGDIPEVRGRQCLVNDSIAVAKTVPGELVHRPGVGFGIDQRVNGPGLDARLSEITSGLKRTWAADARARKVSVRTTQRSTGEVDVQGSIEPIALPDSSLKVILNG